MHAFSLSRKLPSPSPPPPNIMRAAGARLCATEESGGENAAATPTSKHMRSMLVVASTSDELDVSRLVD